MSRVYLWILALDALKRDSLWRQQPATFLQKVCHGFLEGRIVKNPPTFGVLSVTMQWSRERDRPGIEPGNGKSEIEICSVEFVASSLRLEIGAGRPDH